MLGLVATVVSSAFLLFLVQPLLPVRWCRASARRATSSPDGGTTARLAKLPAGPLWTGEFTPLWGLVERWTSPAKMKAPADAECSLDGTEAGVGAASSTPNDGVD
jgi:hypothetical protein